ncbi:MAG TPA: ABC transporter ATP-binding protein [Gordonia sp. (in: high G+C Gram-positive bacteria)]|uniref:ABC transporter ATP-binding protein n=1 Tax=unclassified Gordonia (in: high G+C Gram-positive bacteria) TaxID=2657482 RepID=UPI000FAD718E|nr:MULTISPECIES: ABC transporter ATP-binding protein [unclassified Gordonia (in: high G+C Gram-positive bacteria)]RUP36662.1 MAG: ABC transporter ATP-binding protein [Gordonia sp. (in: high G+C Gram-positive bacteria)]HNP57399.1 ABC transporter ATP-binding protein [Gordonia sp. (in: high G+C Gram-positive bacteria)]HRC50746.1 ABC transporter ATP-binding protein [Gordonia sp. (in: high G+C Gram-positive bacteria)]
MITTVLRLLPPGSRGDVALFTVLAVLSVIARAASAVILIPLVTALVNRDDDRALWWLGAITVATLVGWAADWSTNQVGYRLGFGMLNFGQHSVSEQLSRTRLTWFTPDNKTIARQAVSSTGSDLIGVIIYLMVPMLAAVLLPLAIGIALFGVAWQLAVVALIGVPLVLGAMWASGAIIRRTDREFDDSNAALTERIVEFARTQAALRVSRRVEPERSHVGAALDRQHGASMRMVFMQVPGQILFTLVSQLALFALAGTAAWLWHCGQLQAPEAVALLVVAVRYLEPFTILGDLSVGLEHTQLTLRHIATVIAAPTVTDGPVHEAPTGAPRIELKNVTFAYGDEPPVLQDFNLTLEPGTATAVIGASGSGKSTILGLIAGLYEPDSGQILFDGVDAATLDLAARRALTSVVFQQPYLAGGTIEENIRAGDPTASAEQFESASALARVDEITQRLPDGFSSQVGEGGSVLSGGERQRVSIARALLKPAPVLLIDEATSALDNENERAVVDALSAEDRPRTRVIIAHRQAGIRHADQVVVIDAGHIVEAGAPAELLEQGGRFAEFWEHQSASAGWKLTTVE